MLIKIHNYRDWILFGFKFHNTYFHETDPLPKNRDKWKIMFKHFSKVYSNIILKILIAFNQTVTSAYQVSLQNLNWNHFDSSKIKAYNIDAKMNGKKNSTDFCAPTTNILRRQNICARLTSLIALFSIQRHSIH